MRPNELDQSDGPWFDPEPFTIGLGIFAAPAGGALSLKSDAGADQLTVSTEIVFERLGSM